MDYLTLPISRNELRAMAIVFRRWLHLTDDECVPVVQLLDKFCITAGITYEIVDNDDFDLRGNVPAVTNIDSCRGEIIIKIKEEIYSGALYKELGGYRNHIMHEMCHVFLYKFGYTPISEKLFKNNEIPPARSAEWQAKALCGEIMMPYFATQGMSEEEIVKKYKVSRDSARQRLKY